MKQISALDNPSFRALDGSELLTVIMRQINLAAREVLQRYDGQFNVSKAYPVASVRADMRVSLYHDPRMTTPYSTKDIPVRFWVFTQPDDAAVRGLDLLHTEDVAFRFEVGKSLESAPDALREQVNLPVIQPEKVGDTIVDVAKGGVTIKTKGGMVAG